MFLQWQRESTSRDLHAVYHSLVASCAEDGERGWHSAANHIRLLRMHDPCSMRSDAWSLYIARSSFIQLYCLYTTRSTIVGFIMYALRDGSQLGSIVQRSRDPQKNGRSKGHTWSPSFNRNPFRAGRLTPLL